MKRATAEEPDASMLVACFLALALIAGITLATDALTADPIDDAVSLSDVEHRSPSCPVDGFELEDDDGWTAGGDAAGTRQARPRPRRLSCVRRPSSVYPGRFERPPRG